MTVVDEMVLADPDRVEPVILNGRRKLESLGVERCPALVVRGMALTGDKAVSEADVVGCHGVTIP